MNPIVPTIGRKVWFWHREASSLQAEDATIVYVHALDKVNVRVTNHQGESRAVLGCFLRQPDEKVPEGTDWWCEWTPAEKNDNHLYATKQAAPRSQVDSSQKPVGGLPEQKKNT